MADISERLRHVGLDNDHQHKNFAGDFTLSVQHSRSAWNIEVICREECLVQDLSLRLSFATAVPPFPRDHTGVSRLVGLEKQHHSAS